MCPSKNEVIEMVREKVTERSSVSRHEDLDWTCAVQSVAMEIGRNEQELINDLRDAFEGETNGT